MKTTAPDKPRRNRPDKDAPAAHAPQKPSRLPWIITGVFLLWLVGGMMPPKSDSAFHIREFGATPVLTKGRIQPIDSVARNSLLVIRGKQTYLDESGKSVPAIAWLLDMAAKPAQADGYKVFRIDNPELKTLFGVTDQKVKFFAFTQLRSHFEEIEKQYELAAKVDEGARNLFQHDIVKLRGQIGLYMSLKNGFRPEFPLIPDGNGPTWIEEIELFKQSLPAGLAAMQAGKLEPDDRDAQIFTSLAERYRMLSRFAGFAIVPPLDPAKNVVEFQNVGDALLQSVVTKEISPGIQRYARMMDAYAKDDAATFNSELAAWRAELQTRLPTGITKAGREQWFNHFEPFYKSMVIYVAVFVLVCLAWMAWPVVCGRSAYQLVLLAFIIHTFGLTFRMALEGRPPVTNLYSAAVFVGWGAVALGALVERIYRNGIGAITAATVGFATLIIAHHLAMTGDTLEMMRAVLDSNFWLATHVVIINLGYSSTYLAGALGIIYVVRGIFSGAITPRLGKTLEGMVYGIICFATLFSFVGTVLGGIWADQSWGRFWGWDPKENGALLIVLWNALILHARWGGIFRQRGFMVSAIFGNIITSLSFFGTNLLGVGLHSYGFTTSGAAWLAGFCGSQLVFIALGLLPLRMWKSFQSETGGVRKAHVVPDDSVQDGKLLKGGEDSSV
jgi:ABC-type transport system involved in cytochrome c biogenesis permease subunit